MRLKNVLIIVTDIDKSKRFYHDIFGLEVFWITTETVILTEGLVLQQKKIWQDFLKKEVKQKNHASELYFEEREIEKFVEKLEQLYPEVEYVNKLMENVLGKKIVRFYDLDGNLIEVGTPM